MRRDEHAARMLGSRLGVAIAANMAIQAAQAAAPPQHGFASQVPPHPPTPAPQPKRAQGRWRPVDDRGIEIINEAKAARARRAAKLAKNWTGRREDAP